MASIRYTSIDPGDLAQVERQRRPNPRERAASEPKAPKPKKKRLIGREINRGSAARRLHENGVDLRDKEYLFPTRAMCRLHTPTIGGRNIGPEAFVLSGANGKARNFKGWAGKKLALTIGRNPETTNPTVHIDCTPDSPHQSSTVSRNHALLRVEFGREGTLRECSIQDTGSKNGTIVNATRVQGSVRHEVDPFVPSPVDPSVFTLGSSLTLGTETYHVYAPDKNAPVSGVIDQELVEVKSPLVFVKLSAGPR